MKFLKGLLLLSSLTISFAQAEVNLLLLSNTLTYNKLVKSQQKCTKADCRAAFEEEIDRMKEVLNQYENPKTGVPYSIWSTKEYSQKNVKSFKQHMEALEQVTKACNVNFQSVVEAKSPFVREKYDEKFCKKVNEQFEASKLINSEKKVVKDSLEGCSLSFDQSEISCPYGVYIRSKSVTDITRKSKAAGEDSTNNSKSGSSRSLGK